MRALRELLAKHRRKLVFGAVGVSVMLFSFVQLWIMMDLLGMPTWLAYAIQTVVSVELNFVLNYAITWRDRREEVSFWRAFSVFHATRIGLTIPLNQVLFVLQVDVLHWPFWLAQGICIGLTTVLNYVVGDKLVFAKFTLPKFARLKRVFGGKKRQNGPTEALEGVAS